MNNKEEKTLKNENHFNCLCNNPECAKCLVSNCEDDNCLVHTMDKN